MQLIIRVRVMLLLIFLGMAPILDIKELFRLEVWCPKTPECLFRVLVWSTHGEIIQ
ncbi:hypothetical protein D3C73_1413350 [compost metagenome]